MVVVGGATRLTDSGLSIVEWRPVSGTIPPLSEADWTTEFGKYQTSSEYQIANQGMTLDEFKAIYWWESLSHRLFFDAARRALFSAALDQGQELQFAVR